MRALTRALLIAALAVAATARAAAGQALDSTRTDSNAVKVWSKTTQTWYTRVDTVRAKPDTVATVDTVFAAGPAAGVDTIARGDTTFFAFWRMAKIVDSTTFRVVARDVPPVAARWGPSGYFNGTSATSPASALGKFTYAPNESSNRDDWLLANVAEAKQRGVPVTLAFPCGPHSASNPGYCLDPATMTFSMARFDSALAQRVLKPYVLPQVVDAQKNGYVVAAHIVDEPWVSGGDDGSGNIVGNTWGPKGTITKAAADRLCAKVKALVPGVPVGMSGHLTSWEPTNDVKVCDFLQYQYSYRFGDVVAWRDAVLAQAKRGGYQAAFSFNIINGGTQDRDGTWDCKDQGGVKGQSSPNCQMTPAQVETVVKTLAPYSAGGLMMWRYDDARYASSAYLNTITKLLAWLQTQTQPVLRAR